MKKKNNLIVVIFNYFIVNSQLCETVEISQIVIIDNQH